MFDKPTGLLPFSASRLPSDDRQQAAGVPLRFSPPSRRCDV